jgi:hypothetical protein
MRGGVARLATDTPAGVEEPGLALLRPQLAPKNLMAAQHILLSLPTNTLVTYGLTEDSVHSGFSLDHENIDIQGGASYWLIFVRVPPRPSSVRTTYNSLVVDDLRLQNQQLQCQ